jgi:hypothetical protein
MTMNTDAFYLWMENAARGPVTRAEIIARQHDGTVHPGTLIATHAAGPWTPLADFCLTPRAAERRDARTRDDGRAYRTIAAWAFVLAVVFVVVGAGALVFDNLPLLSGCVFFFFALLLAGLICELIAAVHTAADRIVKALHE